MIWAMILWDLVVEIASMTTRKRNYLEKRPKMRKCVWGQHSVCILMACKFGSAHNTSTNQLAILENIEKIWKFREILEHIDQIWKYRTLFGYMENLENNESIVKNWKNGMHWKMLKVLNNQKYWKYRKYGQTSKHINNKKILENWTISSNIEKWKYRK